MDDLIHLLETVDLGANSDGTAGTTEGGGGERAGLKRKRASGKEDGGGEELLKVPPVNDIYRSRQQKRVHAA